MNLPLIHLQGHGTLDINYLLKIINHQLSLNLGQHQELAKFIPKARKKGNPSSKYKNPQYTDNAIHNIKGHSMISTPKKITWLSFFFFFFFKFKENEERRTKKHKPVQLHISPGTASGQQHWSREPRCRSNTTNASSSWVPQNRNSTPPHYAYQRWRVSHRFSRKTERKREKKKKKIEQNRKKKKTKENKEPFSSEIQNDLRVETDGPGNESCPSKNLVHDFQRSRIPGRHRSSLGVDFRGVGFRIFLSRRRAGF